MYIRLNQVQQLTSSWCGTAWPAATCPTARRYGDVVIRKTVFILLIAFLAPSVLGETIDLETYEPYEPKEIEGKMDRELWGKYNLKSYSYLYKETYGNIPLTRIYVINGEVKDFEVIESFSIRKPELSDFHTVDYLLDTINKYYADGPSYFLVSYGVLGEPMEFKAWPAEGQLHTEFGFEILEVVPLAPEAP